MAESGADVETATFESLGICSQLVEACQTLGWKNPTPIQCSAIPPAIQGRDVIGLAQTGSGKTAAFTIPILEALLAKPSPLFACILSPTRELAIQIAEQCEALGSSIGLKCAVVSWPFPLLPALSSSPSPPRPLLLALSSSLGELLLFFSLHLMPTTICCLSSSVNALSSSRQHIYHSLSRARTSPSTIVGGVDMVAQAIALGKRPHIIVGTPGRLVDHLSNTKGFNLRTLKYLVLDEADRLLNLEFEAEIDEILKVVPKERRTLLFSATMTSKVAKLQRACLKDPVKVEVSSKYSTVDTLRQQYLFVPAKHKDCYLVYVLNELAGSTAMVFTRTCDATRRVALLLRNLGFPAIPISGQMSQPKRLGALNKFKSGDRSILICTDVASRGLDIPSVDMVVNYDIPTNSKDYIHRVGRTARAGRSGRAITIVTQYDVELFQRIEQLIGKKMEGFPAEAEEALVLLERVSEAQRLANMTIRDKDANRKGGRRRTRDDDEEGGGGGGSMMRQLGIGGRGRGRGGGRGGGGRGGGGKRMKR
ncbi:unnamed protein product [Closterium sp. NIES-65]|nr:unnamed protein product [Closterium sp. NIES-65]